MLVNEPPVEQENQKQIRFDFSCKFNNGDRATVEMAMNYRPDELARAEHYVSRLFTAQENRGSRDYNKLAKAYQITLSEDELIKDNYLVHEFEYYDKKRNVSLIGKTRIITFEMSKLKKFKKNISEMDSKERWGAYLEWINDKNKINELNEIIRLEGGIGMATQALRKISKNEEMQILAIKADIRRKDFLSDMDRKLKEGLAKGRAEGIQEGMTKGRAEGRAEGKEEGKKEIARNLLDLGINIERISFATGLSTDEIQDLSAKI
jgi:predicted transposase/invertase (TIGR01784 family)